jgi:hypothetical protein
MTRDEILENLTKLTPVISFSQLREHFFERDWLAARNAVRAWESAGLVSMSRNCIRSHSNADGPITLASKAKLELSAEQIAYRASQRWSQEFSPVLCIHCTGKLATLFGGTARTLASANLSHEIALVDVLLKKRQRDPAFVWELVPLSSGGGSLPDAITVTGAIELVGRYGGATVESKLSLRLNMPLEFW